MAPSPSIPLEQNQHLYDTILSTPTTLTRRLCLTIRALIPSLRRNLIDDSATHCATAKPPRREHSISAISNPTVTRDWRNITGQTTRWNPGDSQEYTLWEVMGAFRSWRVRQSSTFHLVHKR